MTSEIPAATRKHCYSATALVVSTLLSAALAATVTSAVPRLLGHTVAASNTNAEATLYHCPMHPTIVQDHPGNCPICGMKLVKIEKGSGEKPSPSAEASGASPVAGLARIDIDPARQQLIGLKTAEVKSGLLGGTLRSVGRVAIDETRVRRVNLKVPGFVERIYVDYVGKRVKKGDPLFSVYSPELLATQEEYLLAQKTQNELGKVGGLVSGNENGLAAGARRKLELWDISALTLDQISKTGKPSKSLTLYSPIAGVVTRKEVVEGMRLDAGAMPYEITDLSTVWVLVDVYESELRFVRDGMAATLRLSAFPGREFSGKVVFLDPLLDPGTRTVKARLTFPNASGELRPEMFGDVVLHGEPHPALTVPLDAVIDSGTEKVVYLALADGKFEPRVVEVGERDQTQVEVTRGLSPGDRVVIRANFLVDSESRLQSSLSPEGPGTSGKLERARVLPEGAPAPSASGHVHD